MQTTSETNIIDFKQRRNQRSTLVMPTKELIYTAGDLVKFKYSHSVGTGKIVGTKKAGGALYYRIEPTNGGVTLCLHENSIIGKLP